MPKEVSSQKSKGSSWSSQPTSKFYAVRVGRKTGVFTSWTEIRTYVEGFPGARYKSFKTKQEAEQFVKMVDKPSAPTEAPPPSIAALPPPVCPKHNLSFVLRTVKKEGRNNGRPFWTCPGENNCTFQWADENVASSSSSSATKAKENDASKKATETSKEKKASQNTHPVPTKSSGSLTKYNNVGAKVKKSIAEKKKKQDLHQAANARSQFNYTIVYTDGSCLGNGKKGALGGIGAFFGHDDPRNISAPFVDPNPTNQRAEIKAVLETLRTRVANTDHVCIFTDSQYLINAATSWRWNWEKNGWVASSGNEVSNKDIFEPLFDLIDSREGGVRFEHVPGHKGIEGNEQADKLAVRGATQPTE